MLYLKCHNSVTFDNKILYQELLCMSANHNKAEKCRYSYNFQNLTSDSHLVRSSCLQLIGCLESHDRMTKGEEDKDGCVNTQTLLEMFFQDQDPRVRSSAFEALVSENFCSVDDLCVQISIKQNMCWDNPRITVKWH